MILHPAGTPTLTDRIADLAMLKMRSGDFAGAGAAFARSIELRQGLRGQHGTTEQDRWRTWTLCGAKMLHQGWRSPTLRNHLWCALNDLLRDNPPARLTPDEIPVERLRYKLFHWILKPDGDSPKLIAQGTLDDLRSMDEPAPGLYLLGLEVPRLGDESLRRAC